jgi:Domain of unknown function (DUF4386)
MTDQTISPAQHMAAKIVGAWYLFAMAAGMFAEIYIRSKLVVSNDVALTAVNIAAHEGLFRLGAVTNVIVFAGDVILLVALYVILSPVHKGVALLAAGWRVVESSILGGIVVCDFAVLKVLSGAQYLHAFDVRQLQAFARLLISVEAAGFQLGFVFLGLGSALFSYLWLQSGYIPRAIAGWGIFSSLVLALVTLAILLFPPLGVMGLTYMAPMFFYEVGIGIWLLMKGISIRPEAPAIAPVEALQ